MKYTSNRIKKYRSHSLIKEQQQSKKQQLGAAPLAVMLGPTGATSDQKAGGAAEICRRNGSNTQKQSHWGGIIAKQFQGSPRAAAAVTATCNKCKYKQQSGKQKTIEVPYPQRYQGRMQNRIKENQLNLGNIITFTG